MYKHILIPTDGSDISARAIEEGARLATVLGARITVLTVTRPFHMITLSLEQLEESPEEHTQHSKQRANEVLADAQRRVEAASVSYDGVCVEHEHPYEAIIDTARSRGCDLIAVASHGRRGVASLFIGSETTRVLTHSTLPVLVYR